MLICNAKIRGYLFRRQWPPWIFLHSDRPSEEVHRWLVDEFSRWSTQYRSVLTLSAMSTFSEVRARLFSGTGSDEASMRRSSSLPSMTSMGSGASLTYAVTSFLDLMVKWAMQTPNEQIDRRFEKVGFCLFLSFLHCVCLLCDECGVNLGSS